MSPISSLTTLKPRVALGLDPGLARLGWAIIKRQGSSEELISCGCITTDKADEAAERLSQLHQQLTDIFQKFRPSLVAIEKLFFTKNITSGIAVGQARGVALLTAAEAAVPILEFTPTAIKQSITGYGQADKRQVQHMIKALLHLKQPPKSDDTADAIAVALCGLHYQRFS